MELITQTLRNAQAITSPAVGASASSLTVDVVDATEDPTVFDLSSNQIRITRGVGSPHHPHINSPHRERYYIHQRLDHRLVWRGEDRVHALARRL